MARPVHRLGDPVCGAALNDDPVGFLHAMAPVLFANLLTVAFVYACIVYTRREQRGEPGGFPSLSVILMVIGFLAGGMATWGYL